MNRAMSYSEQVSFAEWHRNLKGYGDLDEALVVYRRLVGTPAGYQPRHARPSVIARAISMVRR